MSAPKEEWRDIPGYGGWYQISTEGRVRSFRRKKGRALRPGEVDTKADVPHLLTIQKKKSRGRTATINLQTVDRTTRPERTIAQLMADTWFGGCPPGMKVCHRDRNPDNNRLSNLVLRTSAEQNIAIGRTGGSRRPVIKIDRNLSVVEAYASAAEAARKNDFNIRTMRYYCDRGFKKSVFAIDGFLYVWDDTRSIWAALRQAMRELDAQGVRYNNPFTGRYFDLPQNDDPNIDVDTLWWSQALALAGGATSENAG